MCVHVTHLMLCTCVSCSCLSSSWAASHNISPATSAFHDYLISIYWASATMTTVGYGDISAHNTQVGSGSGGNICCSALYFVLTTITSTCIQQEMILALIIQLTGVMLYGYCLGAIAATLTNVASPR